MSGLCWRTVDAQRARTLARLTDSFAEQDVLNGILGPPRMLGLDPLLAAPFGGAPYRTASRFRPGGAAQGVYYASELRETSLAETAFYRLLFFLESPAMTWPANAIPLMLISVSWTTARGLDMMAEPLSASRAAWTHPTDYTACHGLALAARDAQADAIRFESVRDPEGRPNLALLTPAAFARTEPLSRESWTMSVRPGAVSAESETEQRVVFPVAVFAGDPRIAAGLERRA